MSLFCCDVSASNSTVVALFSVMSFVLRIDIYIYRYTYAVDTYNLYMYLLSCACGSLVEIRNNYIWALDSFSRVGGWNDATSNGDDITVYHNLLDFAKPFAGSIQVCAMHVSIS